MVKPISTPKTHDYVPGVIMEFNKLSIGFVESKVEETLSIDTEDLSETPKFGANANTGFTKNTPKVENEAIMVLEPEKLFKAEELSALDSMAETNWLGRIKQNDMVEWIDTR